MPRPLILASSSPYRQKMLEQLGLPFSSQSPHINEERLPGEQAGALAERLAREKAAAVAGSQSDAMIIGSDQVAECQGRILGKPGEPARAQEQLNFCSGKPVTFHTGLCLLDSASAREQFCVETFSVWFRPLSEQQIARYVAIERPLDCAGSFKVEGLGIALFEKMEGNDYNSLIGLPLIRLVSMLEQWGISPLAEDGALPAR